MGQGRVFQNFQEGLTKYVEKDIWTQARILDTPLITSRVDAEAVNKARLSFYSQHHNKVQRYTTKTEDAMEMQKTRDTQNWAGAVDARSFALDESVEKIYFDYYGEGFDGSPVISRPNAPYICPCGTKYLMGAKALPPECHRCRRLTPIGKLQRDGVIKA